MANNSGSLVDDAINVRGLVVPAQRTELTKFERDVRADERAKIVAYLRSNGLQPPDGIVLAPFTAIPSWIQAADEIEAGRHG